MVSLHSNSTLTKTNSKVKISYKRVDRGDISSVKEGGTTGCGMKCSYIYIFSPAARLQEAMLPSYTRVLLYTKQNTVHENYRWMRGSLASEHLEHLRFGCFSNNFKYIIEFLFRRMFLGGSLSYSWFGRGFVIISFGITWDVLKDAVTRCSYFPDCILGYEVVAS